MANCIGRSTVKFNFVLRVLSICALLLGCLSASATVYDIGPGQTYTTIGAFHWSSLQPGDTVQIHYGTYHEFIAVTGRGTSTQPIRVVGIPDPTTGALPVIDGANAVAGPYLNQQYARGTSQRGLVSVVPYGTALSGYKPGYIEIANLVIQNAVGGAPFTDVNGAATVYNASVASIYIVSGEHIVITNCTITGSSDGFFVASGGDGPNFLGTEATESRDVTLQFSKIYGNGTSGDSTHHNIYTEGSGITFQYNYIGKLLSGALGNPLKDRSAGTVIRYNWIESGGYMVDLVEAQGSSNITVQEPSYAFTYVYGNVFHNTSTGRMIHYGGDHGFAASDRNGNLYVYNNTVIVEADGGSGTGHLYQTELLRMLDSSSSASTGNADVRNNIFFVKHVTAGASLPIFGFGDGGPIVLSANWIGPNWEDGYNRPATGGTGNVTGQSNLFVDPSNNPSFTSATTGDYTLQSGSNAIDKSVALASGVTTNPMGQNYSVVRQYVRDQSERARQVNGTAMDFGAYESGLAGPCSYTFYPTSIVAPFAGAITTLEVTADSGCSWTASSGTSWLTLLSGTSGSGTGNGTGVGNIVYSVDPNGGSARSTSLTVGGQTVSAAQLGYDVTPPFVAVTSPVFGATVSGSAVTLAAAASDNIAVSGVQFTLDGTSLMSNIITSPPYTATWDVSSLAPGVSHSITATATDTSGNATTSAPVTVTIGAAASGTVSSTGTTNYVSNYLPAAQTGIFTIQGDVIPAGDGTSSPLENGLFAVSNGAATLLKQLAAITFFDTGGIIDARNGGNYTHDVTVAYTAGQTYHVRMVINIPSHIYDVYITPPGSSEVKIASAYAFRSEQSAVTLLDHWDLVSSGNTISVSNVVTTTTSQTAPLPTFTPVAGSYSSPQTVAINASVPSPTIYYTTDGSQPTTASAVYSGPLTVSTSEPVNAIVTAPSYITGGEASAAYVIGSTAATAATALNTGSAVFISNYLSATQSGTFTFQGDIIPSGDGTTSPQENGLFAVSNGAATTVNQLAAITFFDTGGIIEVRNGGGYIASSIHYTAGQVYHVRMVVNIPAGTYDVYVTPPGLSEIQIAAAYAFRTEQAGITQMDHWDLVANGNSIRAMNVFIGTGAQAATPTFSPAGGTYATAQTVSVSTTTPSAIIYYTTDGSAATTSSAVYSGPLTVSTSEVINAIAAASGFTPSTQGSATYTLPAATPTFSPGAGTYTSTQTVAISTTTPSASIYYTTDGSTPTTGSSVYFGPVRVSASETVKAIASATGYLQSSIGSAAYIIEVPAATPTFSPGAGTYTTAQTVTINTLTPSATIYYTTDGSTPTVSSPVYSGPITVPGSETVNAIALASGFLQSAVGSAAYTIPSPYYVQQCNHYINFTTTVSCTIGGVGAGHLLAIGVDSNATSLTSVTSTSGTPSPVVTNGGLYGYVLSSTSAGSITITAHFSTNVKVGLSVVEYANLSATPVDAFASGTQTTFAANVSTGNFITTAGSDMLWSMCQGPTVPTAGTAPITWTALPGPSGSGVAALVEDGVAGASGTYYGRCGGINSSQGSIISMAFQGH